MPTENKIDRRRKFTQGDKLTRLSISIPQSLQERILADDPTLNMSDFARKAFESYLSGLKC